MTNNTNDALLRAKEEYHAELVTKNNIDYEDNGVALLLDSLASDNPTKAFKQKHILKPQFLAGLGFLNGLPFDQAKAQFNGLRVDQLIEQILIKYKLLSPDICLHCSKVYKAYNNDTGSNCFLCDKKLCDDCSPNHMDDQAVNKILFPICRGCVLPKLGQNDASQPILQPNTNEDTLVDQNTNGSGNDNNLTNTDSNTKSHNSKGVCKFFLKKCCKHHKSTDSSCSYDHPKLCNNWTKKGRCTDKEKCSIYYHPKLCEHSMNKQICPNQTKCPYYHLPNKALKHTVNKVHEQDKVSGPKKNTTNNGSNGTGSSQNFQNTSPSHAPPIVNQQEILSLLQKLTQQVDFLTKENQERKRQIANQNSVLQWNPTV